MTTRWQEISSRCYPMRCRVAKRQDQPVMEGEKENSRLDLPTLLGWREPRDGYMMIARGSLR